MPMMSRIAPVTEITVERLFSHLKIVLDDRRANLKQDLVKSIFFCD